LFSKTIIKGKKLGRVSQFPLQSPTISHIFLKSKVKSSEGYHNPHWDGKSMDPFKDAERKDMAALNGLLEKYMEGEELQMVGRYMFFNLQMVRSDDILQLSCSHGERNYRRQTRVAGR
jgi:hypothetical protein